MIDWKHVVLALCFPLSVLCGQDDYFGSNETRETDSYNMDYPPPLRDPSAQGQMIFVEELLDIAGYVPRSIKIYQTLPNSARLFQVRLDAVNKGFVFVRWNAEKRENYIANNRIDPNLYYNLNSAREIYRVQTDKAAFSVKDVAIQPADQTRISPEMLKQYRYEKQQMDLETQMKKRKEKSKPKN